MATAIGIFMMIGAVGICWIFLAAEDLRHHEARKPKEEDHGDSS